MVGSPTSRVRNASPLQVLIVQQSKHGIVASGVRASNQTFGTPPHGSDDLVGIGGPAEGLGDVVALCDKALDHRLEIEERSERGVCDEYGGGQMRIRSLFILGGALLLIAANAFAGPKEDVAAATAKWGETLGQNDPDKCSPFMPLTRFSGEHYRQPCDQIERRFVIISLVRSRSCPVLRCRSASN